MKLLLTSAGLSTPQIGQALVDMVGGHASDARVGFIITAANVESGAKDWVIAQLNNLSLYGFNDIDIVDISAPGVDWKRRLSGVDIVYVCGGNTFHLLDQVRKTGFDVWLQDNLQNKVYVGSSAGSIVMTPSIAVAAIEPGDENLPGLSDLTGLGHADFEIEPHCDEKRFSIVEEYAQMIGHPIYAIDDLTAIKIADTEVEIISVGIWRKL